MDSPWQSFLEDTLRDVQVDFNQRSVLMEELRRNMPPLPPVPWHRRMINRWNYWLDDNVTWRFARRRPEEWWD